MHRCVHIVAEIASNKLTTNVLHARYSGTIMTGSNWVNKYDQTSQHTHNQQKHNIINTISTQTYHKHTHGVCLFLNNKSANAHAHILDWNRSSSAPGTCRTVPGSRSGSRRHINGVVSNGVVPKNQICELGAKPAPEICIDSCFVPGYFTRQHQKCNRFSFGGIKRPFWYDPVWYDPVCVVPRLHEQSDLRIEAASTKRIRSTQWVVCFMYGFC